MVYRIYVEKQEEFRVEANGLLSDIKTALQVKNLYDLRIINRYDVEGISEENFIRAKSNIFSEAQVDNCYDDMSFANDSEVFAVEYLPGQFDQRADSAAQCISILTTSERPIIRTAKVYLIKGENLDIQAIKNYIINPVESREASIEKPSTLIIDYETPEYVQVLNGFTKLSKNELATFVKTYALAMDNDDIAFCQTYFRDNEKRDPTITEIRMIDTYWSDHCRHTTFLTNIEGVKIVPEYVKKSFEKYLNIRKLCGNSKPLTLMDIATIGTKYLKKMGEGSAQHIDESEEINACSVKIKVDNNGKQEDWLLMFKNETHNHPTEIEPFGGAATCLGGAIRDPLSGRSYVYAAMRVTGAADPLKSVKETMSGKLPQRKIVTTAANGYSSYGNQIGLATGHVSEIYHPGYAAKRMEIGAVIGAVPQSHVVREVPCAGDVVLLLGGKTGRDGCGGATGSSKSHTVDSLENCGAEVQKGNPPEERKLQRLFRKKNVTTLIKRCNDFGAGGVSVAIGELADGLIINLDAVPKKYAGLDGTELAISESQERMAIVVQRENVKKIIEEAEKENLAAVEVAQVTESPRLVMNWNGKKIVDLSREFLNSNGASKHTDIEVGEIKFKTQATCVASLSEENIVNIMSDLNVCSQKGLVERFDSTIGSNTVLMPFGGISQLTPSQAMAFKIPMEKGETSTCSLMSWGFEPNISTISPYHGGMFAVVQSVAKVVAAGGSVEKCWLSFQEYFERTKNDPTRWGKPFASLLGALEAQIQLKIPAIGGKDSMSGSFEDIDVPPTLVSFAVSTANIHNVMSTEFKGAGNKVYLLKAELDENRLPNFESVKAVFSQMEKLIKEDKVHSVWTLSYGGLVEGVIKMGMGNRIGFTFTKDVCILSEDIGFIFEANDIQTTAEEIGITTEDYKLVIKEREIDLCAVLDKWKNKLEPVFPSQIDMPKETIKKYSYMAPQKMYAIIKTKSPKVLIPVFPGTNCEYDTARAFEMSGATAEIFVVKNLTSGQIAQSIDEFERLIHQSQIIAIPGGFSGGDEPDGSAKFITSFFRNPQIKEAVHMLIKQRDGLMCGICNGFQALVKLGLLTHSEITEPSKDLPTLTYNMIGRHQSSLVHTRIASNKSPWLMDTKVGEIYTVAISHGEGRFIASEEQISQMAKNGQIATQYVDLSGNPTMDINYNPNGSVDAIEGITSPDGRIFGKMAHSERIGDKLYSNIGGIFDQPIFKGAVDYYSL